MTVHTDRKDVGGEVGDGFTPGPWEAIVNGIHGDSWLVCEDVPGHLRPICVAEYGHPRAEANARLIAAAPDLFRAAKRVRARCQSMRFDPDAAAALDALCAALAKAEGKE